MYVLYLALFKTSLLVSHKKSLHPWNELKILAPEICFTWQHEIWYMGRL